MKEQPPKKKIPGKEPETSPSERIPLRESLRLLLAQDETGVEGEKDAATLKPEQVMQFLQLLVAQIPAPELEKAREPGDIHIFYHVEVRSDRYTQRLRSCATLHDTLDLGNEVDAVEAFDSVLRRIFNPLVAKFRREIVSQLEGQDFPKLPGSTTAP
jgi:hypothetical protein